MAQNFELTSMKPLTYFEAGLYLHVYQLQISFYFSSSNWISEFPNPSTYINKYNNKNLGIRFIYKSGTNGAKE